MDWLRSLLICVIVSTGVAACSTTSDNAPETATAAAPASAITPFAGYWVGATEAGQEIERSATVLIEEGLDQQFTVTWRNLEAPEGDAALAERDSTLVFLPGDEAGTWQSSNSGEIAEGGVRAWAVVDPADTLVVNIETMTEDGAVERQTYTRQVTGEQMQLDYVRRVNNVETRTLRGTYIRASEG